MKNLAFICITLLLCLCSETIMAQKYAIHFKDKNGTPYSTDKPSEFLSQRALNRRARFNIGITENDLPVNPAYIAQVQEQGATILFSSKWINCVLISIDDAAVVDKIEALDCVEKAVYVYPGTTSKIQQDDDKFTFEQPTSASPLLKQTVSIYGQAENQIAQINGIAVHDQGYRGAGVLIAILDAGFANVNKISAFEPLFSSNRILMAKDFVSPGNNIYDSHINNHGTCVLSCMAAYLPTQMVGTAPDASYCLLRTEDATSEYLIEEYNWVIGAETADSIGADIINSSLVYTTFNDPSMGHTYADMDGKTTIASIGARNLPACGVFVCTAAGNSGNNSTWPWIGTPADVVEALTVGAVRNNGAYASFSSIGPNAAGDQKPNVMAQGGDATIVNQTGLVTNGSGTSYASPIACGMVACLIQACSDKNPATLKAAIEVSSSQFASPSVTMGYGIPDFYAALQLMPVCETIPAQKIVIYPNPTSGTIRIKSENNLKTARFFDISGRMILEQTISGNIAHVDISNFGSGMYIVRVDAENGVVGTIKIIKE